MSAAGSVPPMTRVYGTASPQQSSPRSIPGGESRRQGIVFHDEVFSNSFDSSSPSPPPQRASLRPRTHTVDGALTLRLPPTATASPDARHRIGSFSSSYGSQRQAGTDARSAPSTAETAPYGSRASTQQTDQRPPTMSKKGKKSSTRRLIKRGSSRPTSPLASPPPSVDSLPLPIPTTDANRVLSLMKRLHGRMKGKVEYQTEPGTPWHSGVCYIEEDKGSLMFDPGHQCLFHVALIADLRGCRVLPCKSPEADSMCLELNSAKLGIVLLLHPLNPGEFELWLASLLCWQQLRPPGIRLASNNKSPNSPGPDRPETRRRGSSAATSNSKDPAIIKVGNVMLWDKGAATSPRAIVKRPSTRDLRSPGTSWRRVSCILQDNGEFKLMNEHDVTVLSVIDLSQLSRSAVQKLDRSVLDDDYCIAVFPIYSSTSKQLSIFRPVYLALDSRVLFEVWFVLLRAFTVPELYGLSSSTNQITEVHRSGAEFDGELFRVEKSIQVRVIEAKIQKPVSSRDHYGYNERDPLVGNYFAEVILDGETRSRTAPQENTKSPFWRETAQFSDLPSTLPTLTVVLKKLEGNMDNYGRSMRSLRLPNQSNLSEVLCGVVEVSLDKVEKGKDNEEWFDAYDEKQECMGSMLIRLEYDELIVLANQDYKPLSDLLHQFGSGLTSQITQSAPGMMRRLSEIFLNIFQVTNTAHKWLSALVEDEIDGVGNHNNNMKKLRFSRRMQSNESSQSASEREQFVRDMSKSLTGEANLLFRGNTLLTQALEFHMRRLGKEYLEEILGEKILEINEINPDCEVDPSRIEREEDLHQHWSLLIRFTTELWEIIASSVKKLPMELRSILKYVRAVADDRYGDFLRTVNYTSVSGFLFLRFICPAILNPKLFGLLRDNPRPRAQRTLTLIAKGLQALANVSQFGKKESWMEPMNKFLGIYRQSFRNYIDQVCAIPVNSDQIPNIVPASYTTPIMILGRMTPEAREGFPSLPYLIDHQKNFAALVRLWLDSHHAHAPESIILTGELGQFHALCVQLQERSDECLAQLEMARGAENESVVTDDLADNLDRASLLESLSPSYASSTVWMKNDPYRPPGSSESDTEATDAASRRHYSRDPGPLRGMSDGLDTMRVKSRNGKDSRGFLSGLIGRDKRSKENAHLSIGSIGRGKSRDKDEKGSRGLLGKNFSDLWDQNNDTGSRH
ncbi:Rho GTPase activation protein [Xylariaceae sp. FL1019]|nr:Rho GTPase activation protein [Xylariaceae sp. FL1019]